MTTALPIADWRAAAIQANARARAARSPGAAPAALTQARSQGRTARAAGVTTEALVEAACSAYAARGLARLTKREPGVRVVRRLAGGRFEGVWASGAPVDYSGTLANGRACHLEVKASSTTNLPLQAHGEARLGAEQARELAEHHRLGAVVAVLVAVATGATQRRPGPPRRWFVLRWPAWERACQEALAEGRKSLSIACLERHGVEARTTPAGWPDWLAALNLETLP